MSRSKSKLNPAHALQIFLLCILCTIPAVAAEVPEGFTITQIATGMISVTRMALLPDGRIDCHANIRHVPPSFRQIAM